MPDANQVVGVTGKEVLTVSRPGQGNDLGLLRRDRSKSKVRLKLINKGSLLKIKDLDGRGSGSAEPVSVGGEGQRVDLVIAKEGVKVLERVKIPKDDRTVLATGSAKRSIRGDSDGGNVASVANVVSKELSVLNVPDLLK